MTSKTKSSKRNSKKEAASEAKVVNAEIQKGLRGLFDGDDNVAYLEHVQQSAESCAGLFEQLTDDVKVAEQTRCSLIVDIGQQLAVKGATVHGKDDKDSGLHDTHSLWLSAFRSALLLDRLSPHISEAMTKAWDKHNLPTEERVKAACEAAPEKEAQAAMAHTTQVRSDCAAILSAIQLKASEGAWKFTDDAGKVQSIPDSVNPWDSGNFKQVVGVCRNIRRTMLGVKKATSSKPLSGPTAIGMMQKITKGKKPLAADAIMAVTRELVRSIGAHVLKGNEAYWKEHAPLIVDYVGKAIGVSDAGKQPVDGHAVKATTQAAITPSAKQASNIRSIKGKRKMKEAKQAAAAHAKALEKNRKAA